MTKVPITLRGAELLREELRRLKSEDRPRIILAISEARAHGDLKENAEYHAAKEQQSFIEGRINEIEQKLGNAEVIDVSRVRANGRIVFGATVGLCCTDDGNEVVYQIVGEDEADTAVGKISIRSPLARALIGKEAGDVAEVQAPGGTRGYDILTVEYL